MHAAHHVFLTAKAKINGYLLLYLFRTHVKTIEDLVLPLFPITYILMLRRRNLSQWVFKFLNDKGGAQRLPSETFDDNCQEMSDTISLAFPSTVFSVVSAEDGDEEESPDQYQ